MMSVCNSNIITFDPSKNSISSTLSMKRLIVLSSLLTISLTAFAQSGMVKFFNALPEDQKHGMKITGSKGAYKAIDTGLDIPCELTLDDKNGYLEIVNTGTGGGTIIIQLVQFKDAKGKTTLACGYTEKGERTEGTVDFFNPDAGMGSVFLDVFPYDLAESDFSNGAEYTQETHDKYAPSEYNYFILPREGFTVKMFHGYSLGEYDCNTDHDGEACGFISAFWPYLEFVWNKKTAQFDLVPNKI